MAKGATTDVGGSHYRLATGIALFFVVVLVAATAYEALISASVIPIGREPGEGAHGSGLVEATVLCVLLLGCFVSSSLRGCRWLKRVPGALIPPLAVAFATARFYSFDPYYAPTLRRMSDGGFVPGGWIICLGGLALAAGLLFLVRPRNVRALTPLALLLIALTVLLESTGH
ncbi:MAG: hypothetical protein ABSC51_11080 [Gaiellaceae bacterium]|jgi:hypothetical protein